MSEFWLVWSNEHQAWWRQNSAGYTRKIDEAGRYDYPTAKSICFPPMFRAGGDHWPPPEIMMPEPPQEVIDLFKEHFNSATQVF